MKDGKYLLVVQYIRHCHHASGGPRDLEARVARLLADPLQDAPRGRYWAAAAGLAGGALAALLLQPGTLYSVHWLLEGLMR